MMAADYDTLVYTEAGGSKLVVADGGEIEIQSGGTLDVLSGATFNFGTFGASMVVNQTDNYPVGIFGNITVAQTTGSTTQRALWARMDVDANLSGTASVTGAELQFRYDGATSIGSGTEAEQYSGAWLYFEQDTSGDPLADYCHASAAFASVETHSDLSLSANTHLSGIEIVSRLGASDGVAWADTTGTTAALFITKAPAATGVTASNWPYGIIIENVAGTGILISSDCATAALNITGTGNARSIMVGAFGQSSNITISSTNNYQFGCFTRVSASEATSSNELRSGWFRTRVDADMDVGSNANWGYGVTGLESQLKFYGGTSDTDVFSWQASALWAQLETDGADSVHFENGCVAAAVFANVGLTATSAGYTTIQTGAVACGVAINSNTATNVTATGDFVGLYIYHDNTALKDFERGIFIDTSCADTGIYIGACDTLGINVAGDCQTALTIAAQTTSGINIATGQVTGINIAGTCSTAGINMAGLDTDDQGMVIVWTGTPSEGAAVDAAIVAVTATSAANGDASDQLIGYYANVVTSTGDQANNILVGFSALVQTEHNIEQMFGGRFEVNFSDDTGTIDQGCAAVYAVCDVDEAVTVSAGPVSAVWAHWSGDSTVGTAETSCFFGDIDDDITHGLNFDVANAQTCTTGIELGDTGTGKYGDAILISSPCDDNGIEIIGTCTDSCIQLVTGTSAHGLYINQACTVDGINIAADCQIGATIAAQTTSAINIATGQVTGINIAGTCSTAGISMGALSTGGQALLVTWTGVGDEATAAAAGICSLTLTSNANAGSDNDLLIGYHVSITAGTDDQANNILVGTDSIITVNKNIDSCAGGRFTVVLDDASGVVDDGASAVYAVATATATSTITAGPFTAVWAQYNGAAAITTSAGDTSCFFGDIDESIDIGLSLDVASAKTCTAGIYFGGAGTYTTGIDLHDQCTTGIDIGTCTTGISVTGTVTEGIDFSGVTYSPDASRTNYAVGIGSRADELTVNLGNAASQNFEPFQMNINFTASAGAPTSTSTVRMVRVRSTHNTADMANLRIMNINTYMDVQKNIQAAYGQMNGVDFQTGTITIGTEAGVGVFNMDCASGTVTGNVRGIIVNMYGASLPSTTSIGVEVRSDGGAATLAEGVRIWSVGSCQLTTGLKMQGTLATCFDFENVVTGCDDTNSEGSRNGRILVVDKNGDTKYILLYDES